MFAWRTASQHSSEVSLSYCTAGHDMTVQGGHSANRGMRGSNRRKNFSNNNRSFSLNDIWLNIADDNKGNANTHPPRFFRTTLFKTQNKRGKCDHKSTNRTSAEMSILGEIVKNTKIASRVVQMATQLLIWEGGWAQWRLGIADVVLGGRGGGPHELERVRGVCPWGRRRAGTPAGGARCAEERRWSHVDGQRGILIETRIAQTEPNAHRLKKKPGQNEWAR